MLQLDNIEIFRCSNRSVSINMLQRTGKSDIYLYCESLNSKGSQDIFKDKILVP